MSRNLLSVGLDVGTTSTQMVVSRLEIGNRASSFSVPEMQIDRREILYRSEVHFTPMLGIDRVDGPALRHLVEAEYAKAGIRRENVDTGAVIITGETSRKENAAAVLEALAQFAGDFVVTTAGPDLESVLAAKGAGAVDFSRDMGKTVLHMDIGGGTSNLAWIEEGKVITTGCVNVGGRLLKIAPDGRLDYVSPVLGSVFLKQKGDYVNQEEIKELAEILAGVLEMAAGLRPRNDLWERFYTREATPWEAPQAAVISFSGGVADCIETRKPFLAFGDIGPELGAAIQKSRLCQGDYILGKETIRATVIGAGSYSTQLSGSTVFYQNVEFPLKNLPVVAFSEDISELTRRLGRLDGPGVIAISKVPGADHAALSRLAENLMLACGEKPILVALEPDFARALGQILALKRGVDGRILCIDRVKLAQESFLDVGAPVGPALPVVVKTLILSR